MVRVAVAGWSAAGNAAASEGSRVAKKESLSTDVMKVSARADIRSMYCSKPERDSAYTRANAVSEEEAVLLVATATKTSRMRRAVGIGVSGRG